LISTTERFFDSLALTAPGKPMFPQLKEKDSLKLLETPAFGSCVVLLKNECEFRGKGARHKDL
jgi:hypothetical protein